MAGFDRLGVVLSRLLWPGRTPVVAHERELAVGRIDRACSVGTVTEELAGHRRGLAWEAKTRSDLDVALDDLPGSAPRRGLSAAVSVATVVWVVSSSVQFLVWLAIGISGSWDTPWWLWTTVPGAAVVGFLWWVSEADYRTRLADGERVP